MGKFIQFLHIGAPSQYKNELAHFLKHACLLLVSAMLANCGGKAKLQPATLAMDAEPALEARNGVAGHSLSRWIDRTPAISKISAFPAASEDCAMIYDPVEQRVIMFGGQDDNSQNLNEVWALDLAHDVWQKIVADGESPPPTEDHSAIYDPLSHRMILYGGENGPTWNNTWSFDLTTHRWRNMTDPAAPAREDHTAIYDSHGKRMVVFGGQENEYENIYEIWALDLDPDSPTFEKWQNLTVEKNHPPGRKDHVAVYDSKKNRMVIYGGWNKKIYMDDTWAFYFAPLDSGGAAGYWKQIKTKKSHPPARRHAAGVYDAARNWFIIVGGFGNEGYLIDVWAFDLEEDVWLNITPGPQPRIDHQAIYDPKSQSLILYGGDARLKGKFHDVWELQIQPDIPLGLMLKEAGAKSAVLNKP